MHVDIQTFTYEFSGRTFAGHIAWDADRQDRRPGIVIVHEWMGPGENVKRRAQMLAELGFVAFAVDMYGVDVRPQNAAEAAAAMNRVVADPAALRDHLLFTVARLAGDDRVDPGKIAAIGYCFGGACALGLARAGAAIAGVVSFHGALSTTAKAAQRPLAKILVLHGAEDPLVDAAKVADFMNEMRAVEADWQFVHYGNAVHAFTNPSAHDRQGGLCFDAEADARSWQHMLSFFAEIFA